MEVRSDMKNPLKTKLWNNELTIGSWIMLGNTSVAICREQMTKLKGGLK